MTSHYLQKQMTTDEQKIYSPDIIGIGEALWDMFPSGKQIGGAPANFVYHMAQFGYNSTIISAIGQDKEGDDLLRSLESKGIHCIIPYTDKPTGKVAVKLDESGIPQYEIQENVAWDFIPLIEQMKNAAQHCRCICFGSLAQRSPMTRNTINYILDTIPDNAVKIFDINLRQHYYDRKTIVDSLKRCNILKINKDESVLLARMFGLEEKDGEKICMYLKSHYKLNAVILTCGAFGSFIYYDENVSKLPASEIIVKDTVGAGDSFTAGFCSAILAGLSVEQAHKIAVSTSAYVCTRHGAMPKLSKKITEMIKRK